LFERLRLYRQREAEERARQWKIEEERRQIEMERKRETIRFRKLRGHCKNWHAAVDIRAFVAAMETSPLAAGKPERHAEWKVWALGHADRIDPLHSDERQATIRRGTDPLAYRRDAILSGRQAIAAADYGAARRAGRNDGRSQ
jgi:hypothetical protein